MNSLGFTNQKESKEVSGVRYTCTNNTYIVGGQHDANLVVLLITTIRFNSNLFIPIYITHSKLKSSLSTRNIFNAYA